MADDEKKNDAGTRLKWFLLTRGDQSVAALLTLLAFLLMGIYWWRQGGLSGRLVEVERLPARTAEFRVNINAAGWTELAQVPEIGETLARRIVEYRIAHGPFKSVDSLQEVSGIGPKTLEKMRPFVETPSPAATTDQ